MVINTPNFEKNIQLSNEAEERFRAWLDKHKIPYMYIQQDTSTFSSVFKKEANGKRPDFMVLIPYFGFIFVDIKYKKLSKEFKTFTVDCDETKIYSRLQREFNLHIWYVLSNDEYDYKTWFWIPVSKILEVGQNISQYKSRMSRMNFFAVPPEKFIQVSTDDSLDKLFSKLLVEHK